MNQKLTEAVGLLESKGWLTLKQERCWVRMAKSEQKITIYDDGSVYDSKTERSAPDVETFLKRQVVVDDKINKPAHYYIGVRGVEIDCLDITEALGFHHYHYLASALAYIFRCHCKGDKLSDLKKAVFYLNREIANESNKNKNS